MGEGGKKRKGWFKTCKDVGREEETGAEENYQSWVCAKMKPAKMLKEKMRLYVSTNLEYVDQSWEDRYWQLAYNEAEICKYLKVLLEEKMRSGCVYLPILGM